jgi:AcrR family transcriptional regulator
MATPRPASSKPASTARHITASARDVFLTEGYEAASMDAIARQADVSKATLYAHFASKETLFTAVMEEQKEEYAAQLDLIANDRSGDLAQQLTRAGINLLTYMLSDAKKRMFRVIFSEGSRIPEICQNFIRTTRQHSHARFTEIFRHGTLPGRFSEAECEEAARLFIAMLRGDLMWNCLVDASIQPKPSDIETRVASAVRLMTKLYASPSQT